MLLIYELFIALLILLEFRTYKTYVAPFFILGGIYMIVPLMLYLLASTINLYPMSEYNLLCTLYFLFVLWSPNILSVFSRHSNLYQSAGENKKYILKIENKHFLILLWFILCVILFTLNAISTVNKFGIANTKNHTMGITAHLGYMALMIAPIVFYAGIKYKRKLNLFMVFVLFIDLLVLQNKLPICILLLQCTYFSICINGSVSGAKIIEKALLIISIVMLLFIVVYAIRPYLVDKDQSLGESVKYGIERFFHYFFSGFISSNEYFASPETAPNGYRVAFGFWDTLYQATFGNGNYCSSPITKWVFITPSSATNVGGLFSEVVYEIGFISGTLYVFGVGCICYLFYNLNIRYHIFYNTSIYLLAVISLSFFCNFFSLFSTIEKLIYVLCLDIFIDLARTKNIIAPLR